MDLKYFRPVGPRFDQPTMIFSGKMSYHANVTAILHFVADVLPRIRASVPDVRLRIIGSEPPPIVQRLADDPRIEVTGYLPDIRPAVISGTVAVCPVTVRVAIQNKILEAMAMGVPVVASALGARGLAAEPSRVTLGISASGSSPNLVAGLETAARLGARTIALLRFDDGHALRIAEIPVHVPSMDYGHAEDTHSAIGHAITASIRRTLEAERARDVLRLA